MSRMTALSRVQTVGGILLAGWLISFAALLTATVWKDDLQIAVFGSAASAIVTVPLLLRRYQWISPWSLVLLAVYAGFGVRGFAIVQRGLDDPLVASLFTLGKDWSASLLNFTIVLMGVALLTTGYCAALLRPSQSRLTLAADYEFGGRFWWVVTGLAAAGFLGLTMFVVRTGGLDLTQLSAKRTAYYTSEGQYAGGEGVWRSVNELGAVALWLATAKFARSSSRLNLNQALVLLGLGLNALALSYYASNRSSMVYIVATAVVVWLYLRRDTFPWKAVGGLAILGLLLLSIVTFQRQQSEGSQETFSARVAVQSISDAAVMNLNFTEIPKTVNVMEAIPAELDYTYGTTIANYLVAPVPRSIWSDKPIIDAGVEVGVKVYDTDGSSIPPGALGELYWAWGLTGILAGSLLLGFLLGWVERLFEARTDAAAAVLYSSAVFDLGFNAVSGSIGYAMFSAVSGIVTVVVALWLARRPRQATTQDHAMSSHTSHQAET